VSLVAYPLAAMVGALVGTITHETTHAVLALALGELEGFGWQGGLAGGPYVDFRAPTRLASEVIRKAPLALGASGLVALALSFDGLSVSWVALAGAVLGLLWTSPEDLSRAHAAASAGAD